MKIPPLASLALLLSLSACATSAQHAEAPAPQAAGTPIGADDGLLLYSAGRDAWLVDPKDRELRAALNNVDERIAELPAELEKPEFPAAAIQFALDLFAGELALRASLAKADEANPFPIHAQLSAAPSKGADGHALAERFAGLLNKFGMPALGKNSAKYQLQMIPLGPLSIYHGVPEVAEGAGSANDAHPQPFVIALNDVTLSALDARALGVSDLPQGVEPYFAFKLDYGQYMRALEMIQKLSGQNPAAVNPLTVMGFDELVVYGGFGHGKDRSYGAMRTEHFVSAARKNGTLADGPLSAREIALVPKDATWAVLGRGEPSGTLMQIRAALAPQAALMGLPEGTDLIDMLATETGFDLESDLFDHLGQTWCAYMSDTTGGGGLLSGVAIMKVREEKALRSTLDWAESQLNDLATAHAKGYIKLQSWAHEGHELSTLTFPGLPVPIEISYALEDGWFFAALSPQALVAAIAQARSGKNGLTENARFAECASGSLDDLYSLHFTDVPRLARDGYGAVNLLCAALSNGARSPLAPGRGPVAVLPPYNDLMRDAKAIVALGRLAGDDMVVQWQMDRSLLVNACGIAGFLGGVPTMATLGALGGLAAATEKHKAQIQELVMENAELKQQLEAAQAEAEQDMQSESTEPNPGDAPDQNEPK